MTEKLCPGGAADNVTRLFLTDSLGKNCSENGIYCVKFFLPLFFVCTTILLVKTRRDKLDEMWEGK
jgi:hypothetical protein